ncbi:MAG: EAL domain-containing protein [Acidobacteria bacterium]|nr:EAL domain-containing protein [Acidobacteriota bacterium]MBV9186248.1 EAL domain-containing protein [Acidobacteriota bacterium]
MKRRTLLHDILGPGGLSILFQPIFETNSAIKGGQPMLFALEALARGPKGSNVEPANVLFEYVRRKGKEVEVDRACIARAIAASAGVPGSPAISVNVHASTLERDPNLTDFLIETCSTHDMPVSRLILEIVEQQKFWDERAFFDALNDLRGLGVRIALDDIGIGYSSHRMLIEVRPELFKIDRYFINGCTRKPSSRAAIESIVLLASRLGGRVVAEGIETLADFDTVTSLGIDLVQGFYFARPALPLTAGGASPIIHTETYATNRQEQGQ